MFELALFPLNVVLFPGMPMWLHIFEERYKVMVNKCIENEQPFGVVLIKEGIEAAGPLAQPYLVGSVARIVQVERLEKGRMNIAVIGQQRFSIRQLITNHNYLSALVELFPLVVLDEDTSQQAANLLKPAVERYIESLSSASEVKFPIKPLPDDAIELAYAASILLQTPLDEKQRLLELPDTLSYLQTLMDLFRREQSILKAMIKHKPVETQGKFSNN